MPFIKVQKLSTDGDGNIIGGSASLVDTVYVRGGKFHSKQVIRELLGKVLWLDPTRKSGIFLSPSRGLVRYSAVTDTFDEVSKSDKRIAHNTLFAEPAVHTVFGDAYWLLTYIENEGLGVILRDVFCTKKSYERLLCHTLHSILKDGSKISCDNFIDKSFVSNVFTTITTASLRSDTAFFLQLGQDQTRMAFFQAYVKAMKRKHPKFGSACYVDSTPLPNDIDNNPFNALCSHGVGECAIQTRLVLVLDEETGLPVWYDIIPGNILDLNTILQISQDVSVSLDITIDSFVLDAGYICKELLEMVATHKDKKLIGRMPAKRGYPFKDLYYHQVKPFISRGKYTFVREGHLYFGKKVSVSIFDQFLWAYVYVDKNNALQHCRDYIIGHAEEYESMTDADKDWIAVKFGYFVLLSNQEMSPAQMLTKYFARTQIETVFKTSKEYLQLLPLSKWSAQTVRGKILHDIINTIIYLGIREKIAQAGISVSELCGKTQSLMCMRNAKGTIMVETPNKKTKEYYKLLGMTPPACLQLDDYKAYLGLD